jgi:hypothetical protein
MLAERVTEWTEKWKQEGEAVFLIRLLESRFGPLNEFNRNRILHADSETLLRWGGANLYCHEDRRSFLRVEASG